MLKAFHKRSLKHFDMFWSNDRGWLAEVTTLGNIDGMGCGTAVTQLHSKVVVQKAAVVVAIWLADDYSIMFAKPFFVESQTVMYIITSNPVKPLWNRWYGRYGFVWHLTCGRFFFSCRLISPTTPTTRDPELRTVLFGVPRRFRCGECSKPWQLSYSAWLSDKVAKLANQINDFQGLSNFNICQWLS